MAVITARGIDSAAAMEEVVRRLGADAFILSTTSRDGVVEIKAANDPSAAARPQAETEEARPRSFADLLQARSDWAPLPALRPAVTPRALTWSRDAQDRREAALLDRLTRDFLDADDALATLPPRVIIAGPAGAGKSMLAVRLAAQAIVADSGLSPRIIAPRIATPLSDDRLRGWARLIGVAPERPLIGDLMQGDAEGRAVADARQPQIIDLSDVPDASPELAASLGAVMPSAIILAIPCGLSPRRTETVAAGWAKVGAKLCFTCCDLSPPELPQIDALIALGLRLSRFAAGRGLVDQLHRPARDDLARWLQEAGQDVEKTKPEAAP